MEPLHPNRGASPSGEEAQQHQACGTIKLNDMLLESPGKRFSIFSSTLSLPSIGQCSSAAPPSSRRSRERAQRERTTSKMALAASLLPPGVDPSHVPCLQPPPGVTPNFIDPKSRAPGVRAACGIMTAIMVVTVALRMYGKAFIVRSFAWEDAACVIATISCLAYFGVVMELLHQGLGVHMWDVPITVFLDPKNLKKLQVVYYMHGLIMIFVKLSILLLYFRLFAPFRFTKLWIYIGVAMSVAVHLASTVAYATACIDLGLECSNKVFTASLVVSAVNAINDFYLLLLPLLVISRLQMGRSRKISVGGIFATGLSACVISVVILWYRVHTYGSKDVSWTSAPLNLLLVFEIDIGIIVGCLPLLPVLVTHERGFRFPGLWWNSISSLYLRILQRASKASQTSSGGYGDGGSRKGQSAWPGENKAHLSRGGGTLRHYVELGNFSNEISLKEGPMVVYHTREMIS